MQFLAFALLLTLGVAQEASLEKADKCLTELQKAGLQNTMITIQQTLVIVDSSLRIAMLHADNATKIQLTVAMDIVNAIDDKLLSSLSRIYEESCGTCEEITQVVNDAVTEVKTTLVAVVPDWQTNQLFVSITTYIDIILAVTPSLCYPPTPPSTLMAYQVEAAREDCLTPEQRELLSSSIVTITQAVVITQASLRIAALSADPATQANIETLLAVLNTVDDKFISQLQGIVDSRCGTCTEISQMIDSFVTSVKNTLTTIEPDWKTNPTFISVTTFIDVIIAIFPTLCPPAQ